MGTNQSGGSSYASWSSLAAAAVSCATGFLEAAGGARNLGTRDQRRHREDVFGRVQPGAGVSRHVGGDLFEPAERRFGIVEAAFRSEGDGRGRSDTRR